MNKYREFDNYLKEITVLKKKEENIRMKLLINCKLLYIAIEISILYML